MVKPALMKKTGRHLFTIFQSFLASLFGTERVPETEARWEFRHSCIPREPPSGPQVLWATDPRDVRGSDSGIGRAPGWQGRAKHPALTHASLG